VLCGHDVRFLHNADASVEVETANVLESTVGKLFKLHQKKPKAFQGF
jgi:hypothetical protein